MTWQERVATGIALGAVLLILSPILLVKVLLMLVAAIIGRVRHA